MIWQTDSRWLEAQITSQCAPLLAGLKTSNLLIVPKWAESGLKDTLRGSGLSYYCMSEYGDKKVYLLYCYTELTAYLAEPEVQMLLREVGYKNCNLDSILWQVSEKYEDHQKSGSEFPHELGLLLGYPAVDVRGFMKNAGKNFLYSGYWKVYGNLSETLHLFYEFGQARRLIPQLFLNGYSITDIVEFYRRNRLQQLAI